MSSAAWQTADYLWTAEEARRSRQRRSERRVKCFRSGVSLPGKANHYAKIEDDNSPPESAVASTVHTDHQVPITNEQTAE